MTRGTKALIATILSAPLAFNAGAQDVSAPQYAGNKAQSQLDQFCSPANLKTRTGHKQCLQETAGQSSTYAESFHRALFVKTNIEPSAYTVATMIEAMEKIVANKDDMRQIRYYAQNCSKIPDIIFSADQYLDYGYTTAYNLPKHCVSTAYSLSQKYGIATSPEEGQRLLKQFDRLETYYTANANIPGRGAIDPEKITLSGCTSDSHGINISVMVGVTGDPEKVSAFNLEQYTKALNKAYQLATRRSTAHDFTDGDGTAPKKVHEAIELYGSIVGKSRQVEITYKPLPDSALISDDPIKNCPNLSI